VYYSQILLFVIVGLCTTLYLSVAHYRIYMDIGYKSFCAISRSINCDTVSQSTYAVLMGMPLGVWGFLGYVFVLMILLFGLRASSRPRRLWAALQLIAFFYCLFDLYLAWISAFRIKSYCIMCMVTYVVNFGILFCAWLTRRRFNRGSLNDCLREDGGYLWHRRKLTLPLAAGLVAVTIVGMSAYPAYWQYRLPETNSVVAVGRTQGGRPWIGARSPELVIEEYSDYLCFQCAKMHTYLRELVNRYPEKIRLVHYNFPMDRAYNPLVQDAFHEGSGNMALLAIYAEKHDRFWEMNDILYEKGRWRKPIGLRALSARLGLDHSNMARAHHDRELLRQLWQDIRSGLKHHITATPSFVINGVVYQGVIPAEVLQRIMD
jgi:uncharacterized membrane protein/protein-disulfide isomerase